MKRPLGFNEDMKDLLCFYGSLMSYGSSKIALSSLPFRVADFFRGYRFVHGSRTPMFVQSYNSVQTLSTSTALFFRAIFSTTLSIHPLTGFSWRTLNVYVQTVEIQHRNDNERQAKFSPMIWLIQRLVMSNGHKTRSLEILTVNTP